MREDDENLNQIREYKLMWWALIIGNLYKFSDLPSPSITIDIILFLIIKHFFNVFKYIEANEWQFLKEIEGCRDVRIITFDSFFDFSYYFTFLLFFCLIATF